MVADATAFFSFFYRVVRRTRPRRRRLLRFLVLLPPLRQGKNCIHGFGVIGLNGVLMRVLPKAPPLLGLFRRGLQHSNPQWEEVQCLVTLARDTEKGGGGEEFHTTRAACGPSAIPRPHRRKGRRRARSSVAASSSPLQRSFVGDGRRLLLFFLVRSRLLRLGTSNTLLLHGSHVVQHHAQAKRHGRRGMPDQGGECMAIRGERGGGGGRPQALGRCGSGVLVGIRRLLRQ